MSPPVRSTLPDRNLTIPWLAPYPCVAPWCCKPIPLPNRSTGSRFFPPARFAWQLAHWRSCRSSCCLPPGGRPRPSLPVGLRLSRPFGATHWPREHNLALVDLPQQLVVGSTLELELTDADAALPEDVEILLRQWRSKRWHQESLPLTVEHNLAKASLTNVQQSLEIRAIGGDHRTMPWQKVVVVEPPRVESLKATVKPPAYLGVDSFDWQPGLQLLEGSKATVLATFDQPVRSATLIHESGKQYLGELTSIGREVRCHLEKSGSRRCWTLLPGVRDGGPAPRTLVKDTRV